MEEKMLVLLDIIDGQVIVKGVCRLESREMADRWAAQDKHRFVYEADVLE